ncbi:sodium-translocating pyrophosphatase [Candidatus Sumerlaeota bacterium]|nr:sodium-translocating pyrophosphatase [Candidatus Sumerlaeota bacterium]
MIWIPIVASLIALIMVVLLAIDVRRKPQGNATMVEISLAIQTGAKAFLKREYSYIAIFVAAIVIVFIAIQYWKPDVGIDWRTAAAFVAGAVASLTAGYIGMSIATQANARTAQAAQDGGVSGALSVAITGGGVMGMAVVGVALLGLCIVFVLSGGETNIVNGYAMGASLVALFARSGGGIYTKGADMGADLVGKLEAGIPEDDPRNAATIADNVGDNVGDVAGLGSDLMESYVEAMIAAVAITSSALIFSGSDPDSARANMVMIPFMIASVGILASIVGILYIRVFSKGNPQSALMRGTYVAGILTIVGTYFVVRQLGSDFTADEVDYQRNGIFISTIIGVVSGTIIGFVSEFFTSAKYFPTRRIAANCESGPALTITEGLSVGMASCAIPTLVLAVAILLSYNQAGFYGVALAAFGMLATTGIIVSVDSYGPIADNAGGIAEMSHLDRSVREITDNLDSVGNTTAAMGKGFAIGSAAFAALGLLVAYMAVADVQSAELSDPNVLAGLLIGGMFPYFFSSTLFRAVTKSAFAMIEEVRRQFREIPGIMEGKAKPDYARCVTIATDGAIRGMLLPGGLAIVMPLAVGLSPLGKEGLTGVLVGALISGLMIGIQMANSGGALDNAKKYIEEGHHGGKGSDAHKAAIIGDTVGDPLKDTVGPSINILIKLMCVISLVFAPLLK